VSAPAFADPICGRQTLAGAGNDGSVRLWGLSDRASGSPIFNVAQVSPGHATFDLMNNCLVEADGEAWRYLFDLTTDEHGHPVAVPWEVYGALSKPTLFQAQDDDEAEAA
jgi:hypothetical protein